MKTKILITGGSGFLGSRLAYYYRERFDLLLPSHSELNISREEAVKAYMEEHRPEVVIHCAAWSNTWYCEQHPEESHRVNVQGTVRIAKACKQIGAKLIFMSSDQVYNGTPMPGPLKEEDVLAIETIEEIGSVLGRAIAGLINVFNPELVVIGGTMSNAREYLLHPIKAAFNKHSLNIVSKDMNLKFSKLGNKAGALGACLISRSKMLGLV